MIPIAYNILFLLVFLKSEPLISPKETGVQNGINMGEIERNWFAFQRPISIYLTEFLKES